MTRVILDANIYISALLKPDGGQAGLVQRGFQGLFEIVISESIFLEICRVLEYPRIAGRIPLKKNQVKKFLENLTVTASWTADEVRVRACEDPDDDMYLSCAQESQASFLVSCDQHLLRMRKFGETVILDSKEFSEFLLKSQAMKD